MTDRNAPKYALRNNPNYQVGYLNVKLNQCELFIQDLYFFMEEDRSKGIGTKLLSLVIMLAARKGVRLVWGRVSVGGSRVYSFYKRLGFEVDAKQGKVTLNLSTIDDEERNTGNSERILRVQGA